MFFMIYDSPLDFDPYVQELPAARINAAFWMNKYEDFIYVGF